MRANELDEHALNLGKLTGNFHSLEFALRAFLLEYDEVAERKAKRFPQSVTLHDLNQGDVVPDNAFTDYDTLGQLIDKYNGNPKVLSAGLTIDRSLVDIRDAIAHGRVSGLKPEPPLKLLKFGKPRNHRVRVTFSVEINKEWFSKQVSRVYEALVKVVEAKDRLHSGSL